MKTYCFAGASNRALHMFAKPMLTDYRDDCQMLGIYDINIGRAREMARLLGGVPVFEDFTAMLAETKPDRVIVTTVDVYHSDYIIEALEAGCDVISEKPMTTDAARVRAVRDAERRTGRKLTVTFNYRYAPFATRIKELLTEGAVGDPYSVHFEWLLTRNMAFGAHGASYFRRWNARMGKSGGLLVHKSTHHFDLVNWYLGQRPESVTGLGRLNLYGAANAPFRGERCSTCPHRGQCEFAYTMTEFEQSYYGDQEAYDNYWKDNCVYAEDIDIYDTMAVLVQYDGGALLSYSLNATTPYEGWHMAINGSRGRIEATNYETGVQAQAPEDHIRLFDLNDNVIDYRMTKSTGGHGGGDQRLLRTLYRGDLPDPLGHSAGSQAGADSVLIGAAANVSIREGRQVRIAELLRETAPK